DYLRSVAGVWTARAHQPQHAICGIEIPSALETNRAAPSSRTGPASSSYRQRTDLNPSGRTGAASTICNDGQAPTAEMAVTPPSTSSALRIRARWTTAALQVETVEVVGHPLRAPTDALMITDEPWLSIGKAF